MKTFPIEMILFETSFHKCQRSLTSRAFVFISKYHFLFKKQTPELTAYTMSVVTVGWCTLIEKRIVLITVIMIKEEIA